MPEPRRQNALMPLDISGLAQGNTGVAFAHRLDSGRPGPDVLVTALVHGNELCGAHALVHLLDQKLRPVAGSLTLCFCNVDAYHAFDPDRPARSRYVDEDFNRVWDIETLEGSRLSSELARAREIRPLLDQADLLLDLHSMQTDCEPLMLSGLMQRARELARQTRFPRIIVVDAGHASGRRMRDYGRFGADGGTATALLAECGQHLDPAAAESAKEILARFLLAAGSIDRNGAERLSPMPERTPPVTVEITHRVTVRNGSFHFDRPPESLDMIPKAGTLIGHDGETPVLTPHDDCVLVMPSRRLTSGQTAVRLGRYID